MAALVLAAVLSGASAHAEGARKLTPAQQKAWPELKALELEKLTTLQSLNQKTEQCIRQANNLEAGDACMREERKAHQSLRQQMHQQHDAIRQRYGLPARKPLTDRVQYNGGQEPNAH